MTPTDPTGIPNPESAARQFLIRFVAVAAIVATIVYLGWRTAFTVNLDAWYLSIPLLVLEIHAGIGLALFTFSLWDVDRRPVAGPPPRNLKVAVLVPTYNEGPEILVPTVAAAVALEPVHETWVLDDGNRPEVARMAAALGARYLARPEHAHAKAGNINHALGVIDAEIIAVLDADHVARPGFLTQTLGYFSHPRVALVQTPQDFYNASSFEHDGAALGQPFHEQTLFYRLLQPGKNRWNGAFWCGTGALVRTDALRAVGGAATETITEDIHTTIRLHRRGWQTVYHNEVLARGLAASDAAQYQLQRNRWGTGAMQVLRTENPLVVSGLTLPQRLSYASTLLGWFDAWRTLGLLALPPLVLLTGAVPIAADGRTFLTWFAITYACQQTALYLLGRGAYRPFLSILFEIVRMTPNLVATMTLLVPRSPHFSVTPKGRIATDRGRAEAPKPLFAVLALSFVAATIFALVTLGVVPLRYAEPWAAWGAFGWLAVNAGLVWAAIGRIRSLRFAAERRASVRFGVDAAGTIDGVACQVQDVSVGGTLVATNAILPEREAHLVTIRLGDTSTSLWTGVRSVRQAPSGEMHYALEFLPDQYPALGELTRAVFNGGFPETMARQQPWAELLRRELAGLSTRFRRDPQRTALSGAAGGQRF
ncbi:MAG: glycosyltransferase [Chloroflexota bacterium]